MLKLKWMVIALNLTAGPGAVIYLLAVHEFRIYRWLVQQLSQKQ